MFRKTSAASEQPQPRLDSRHAAGFGSNSGLSTRAAMVAWLLPPVSYAPTERRPRVWEALMRFTATPGARGRVSVPMPGYEGP